MAGDWYTLHDAAGVIRAHTSILPDPVPAGLTVVTHASRQDQGARWNAATRTWDPMPAIVRIDRLQDLAAHPYVSDVWSNMTAARRTKLRKLIVWLLGTRRYRLQSEDVAIDPDGGWPADPANAVE